MGSQKAGAAVVIQKQKDTLSSEKQPPGKRAAGGRIRDRLQSLRGVLRASIWTRGLSILVISLALLACLSFGIDRAFRLSVTGRSIALVFYLAALCWVTWKTLARPALLALTDSLLADLVESRFPGLSDRLRSAVSFLGEPTDAAQKDPGLTALLKQEVTRQAAEDLDKIELAEVVDSKKVSESVVLALSAACLLSVVASYTGNSFGIWLQRQLLFSEKNYQYQSELEVLNVQNGVLSIPRGDTLRIVAKTIAGKENPARISIRFEYSSGGRSRHYMDGGGKENPDHFEFEHPSVTEDFSFRLVEEGRGFFSNYHSPQYLVKVQERPEVEQLTIERTPPEYTGLGTERIEGDIGELAVPTGSRLSIEGRSNKALEGAVLETEGKKIPLQTSPEDPRIFTGSWKPDSGGTCLIRLKDKENVPPEGPFQFSVHMVEDRAPLVQAHTRNIGQMITAQARIPLSVNARDDYGIDSALLRWTLETPEETEDPVEIPLPLPEGKLPSREGLKVEQAWDITSLGIKPEKRLNLQVGAGDNDRISGSKKGYSGIMSFLVVTPEKLGEEFLRRELEQRRVLERLTKEERTIRDSIYALVDQTWSKPGKISNEDLEKMRNIAATERQHGRQLLAIAAAIEHILEEMKNNRIGEADDLGRLAELIIEPLRTLGTLALPRIEASLKAIGTLPDEKSRVAAGLELGRAIDAKIQEMENILIQMQRLEGFTEIVKHLRAIIRTQTESGGAIREAYRSLIDDIFEDDLFEEDKGENRK